MSWLIRLYPPAWRRRYGPELAELLARQPASFRTVVDVAAGAVDAWVNPQSSTAALTADPKGQNAMVAKMLKLACAGHGSTYTRADAFKAAWMNIAGTLALVLAVRWAMARYGKNDYLEGFLMVSWLVPFVISQRYTSLKGRSGRVQTVLIGGPVAIIIGIVLVSAWINSN
jgi:hypothetical protein